MSYSSTSNNLDEKEICTYLNMTNKMGIADLIRYVWKQGYEWGYQCGYEENEYE